MPSNHNFLPLMIEVEDLQAVLSTDDHPSLLLVDLGAEERFLNAHIPNARLVLPGETQAGQPVPGLAPSDEKLTQLMQRIGLTEDTHVVVYDDEGGGWAGRFIWLLDEIGHTRYSYLNGGILAWQAAGYPLETGKPSHQPSSITVSNRNLHSYTLNELKKRVIDKSIQIWDARSPLEYSGEKVNAAKGGHIPGAKHYEWTTAMDQSRQLRLKPLDVLAQELANVGIDPEKETATHCQSHHRSGLTYLIGKLLNFKSIKAYPGSWGEWGNQADTPVE